MIKHLRTKFIRIAMLSVALVLLVLSLIVNAANFISTNRDLNQTLDMIYENQGTIPTGRTAGADGSPSENPAEDDTPSDPATQSGKPQEDAEEEDHTPPPETDHTPPKLEEKPDTKPSSQPERPRGGRLTPKRRTPRVIFTYALTRTEISTAAIFRTLPP